MAQVSKRLAKTRVGTPRGCPDRWIACFCSSEPRQLHSPAVAGTDTENNPGCVCPMGYVLSEPLTTSTLRAHPAGDLPARRHARPRGTLGRLRRAGIWPVEASANSSDGYGPLSPPHRPPSRSGRSRRRHDRRLRGTSMTPGTGSRSIRRFEDLCLHAGTLCGARYLRHSARRHNRHAANRRSVRRRRRHLHDLHRTLH